MRWPRMTFGKLAVIDFRLTNRARVVLLIAKFRHLASLLSILKSTSERAVSTLTDEPATTTLGVLTDGFPTRSSIALRGRHADSISRVPCVGSRHSASRSGPGCRQHSLNPIRPIWLSVPPRRCSTSPTPARPRAACVHPHPMRRVSPRDPLEISTWRKKVWKR